MRVLAGYADNIHRAYVPKEGPKRTMVFLPPTYRCEVYADGVLKMRACWNYCLPKSVSTRLYLKSFRDLRRRLVCAY